MDDDEILRRGGSDRDIEEYAKDHGANLREEDIHKEIDEAAAVFDLPKLVRLTGLPEDVIKGERKMTRKERRAWYRDNHKRLKLPVWGQLETLRK